MENAAYIRSFNEIYADLTAEELIVLYRWFQAEELLTPRDGTNFVKIGYSKKSVGCRLRNLQTGNPVKLKVIHTGTGNRESEHRLHCKYQEYKAIGEWFKLPDKVIAQIINPKREYKASRLSEQWYNEHL